MDNDILDALEKFDEKKLTDLFLNDPEKTRMFLDIPDDSWEAKFYSFIIYFLTHIDVPEEKAKECYFEILEHKYILSEKMDRDIGIHTAAMDYFLNITRQLKNPKIIEASLLQEIMKMGKEDQKTGCFNAKFLHEYADKEIKRSKRYSQNLSVLILDIDNFKTLNDKYGHLFGDKILKKFVEVLKASSRDEDFLARFGGDEFIVLMPQTGRIGARALAERIKSRLQEYFVDKEFHKEKVSVTFSGGIATYPYDADNFETLMKRADQALYKSKFLGKNRVYDYLEEEYLQNLSNVSDKRQYKRYGLKKNAVIEIGDKNSFFSIKGKIVDISKGGILLECLCEVADNLLTRNLGLKVDKIGDYSLDMPLSGNIVRISKDNDKLKFHLGIAFKEFLNDSIWVKIENSGALWAKEKVEVI
ncbi:MAG: hypothetical protein A2Y41_01050 [Spirochaetes bacterium GWB1_36_13]|nr:MAG: hypothetical protein A2Y41_01050 [Spirochaetes bacterium GWB1_36_13]